MAYASVLWLAMAASLGLYLSGLVVSQLSWQSLKRSLVIGATLVATNAFWLLPNIYFITQGTDVVEQARINRIFSEEAFLHNKSFGHLSEVALVKGFLFNWNVYDYNQAEFTQLLQPWRDHVSRPEIQLIGYVIFGLSALGVGLSLLNYRSRTWVLVPVLGLSLVMLINMNQPFEPIFAYLRDNFDAFREGLRNPFTKFSILYMFGLSIYFAVACQQLLDWLPKKFQTRYLGLGIGLIVIGSSLTWYGWPMFQGELISRRMQQQIPQAYFDLFEWFHTQDTSARVATFPVHSMWGWEYNQWGYQGAGFIWFGLPQSVLVRDFDRWSPHNEGFFRQINYAVYNQDQALVEQTLAKYAVDYVIVDRSVISPGSTDQSVLYLPEFAQLADRSEVLEKVVAFDFLTVYRRIQAESELAHKLVVPESITAIQAATPYTAYDPLYQVSPNYISQAGSNQVVYPFAGIDDTRQLAIEYQDDRAVLEWLVTETRPNQLIYPDYIASEQYIPVGVAVRRSASTQVEVKLEVLTPEVRVDGQIFDQSRIWQQTSFNLDPEVELGWLSVADESFSLADTTATSEFQAVGRLMLDVDDTVTVSLYGNRATLRPEVTEYLAQRKPLLCADPSVESPLEINEGNYKLEVGDESVCIGTEFRLEEQALVEVSFTAESRDSVFPWLCMLRRDSDLCLNANVPQSFSQSGFTGEYLYQEPLSADDYWFSLVIQGQDSSGFRRLAYRDYQVRTYPLLAQTTLNLQRQFGFASNQKVLSLPETAERLTVTLPNIPILTEDFDLSRGAASALNCDLYSRGEVEKDYILSGISYQAKNNGVSCDYFDYLRLPTQQGYILRVAGENTAGRSPKLYLFNRSAKRMDIEELLDHGSFDQSFVILPRTNDYGYTLNVETRAFGKDISKNLINRIDFLPIPYHWLQQVNLTSPTNEPHPNQLQVFEIEQFNPMFIWAQVAGRGSIGMARAENPGWQAVLRDHKPRIWDYWLLPLQSQASSEKVTISGWHNGWLVDTQSETAYIWIVYWPQYFQWLGWGIGGLWILGFLIKLAYKN